MEIYDKAAWHIDAGEDSKEVIAKFREVFSSLNDHHMLSGEGEEMLEFIDSSISLNERMVTPEGAELLRRCYDDVINCDPGTIRAALEEKLER